MPKRKGRTSRKRKNHKSEYSPTSNHDIITLLQWMNVKWEFKCRNLNVVNFKGTGRGVLTKKSIKPGDVIISVPEKGLIGVKTACEDSVILQMMLKDKCRHSKLSGLEALCIFLVEEKRKVKLFKSFQSPISKWTPYIASLPMEFCHPICWGSEMLRFLPAHLYQDVLEKVAVVSNQFNEVNNLLKNTFLECSVTPETKFLHKPISWNEYVWAWCCVNTRCIYSSHKVDIPSVILPSKANQYYLVPFLDMLNHSANVEVETKFNKHNSCFEILSLTTCKKYEQVFINYGAHENDKLLLEYGFVSTNDENLNDVVRVELDDLERYIPDQLKSMIFSILNNSNWIKEMFFGYNGPSWALQGTVLFISLSQNSNIQTMSWLRQLYHSILQSTVTPTLEYIQIDAQRIVLELYHRKLVIIENSIKACQMHSANAASDNEKQSISLISDLWTTYMHMLKRSFVYIRENNVFADFFWS